MIINATYGIADDRRHHLKEDTLPSSNAPRAPCNCVLFLSAAFVKIVLLWLLLIPNSDCILDSSELKKKKNPIPKSAISGQLKVKISGHWFGLKAV